MKRLSPVLPAILTTALLTALCASGLLLSQSNTLADTLYQRPGAPDDRIVVVGIDQYALEEFGPFPWPRDVLAQALDYLNADPDQRPAVIGVDVLFTGESDQPEADAWLAEAAGQYENVVTATAATFGSALITAADGDFYMDDYAVLSYVEPFEALRAVTAQGSINAMLDTDGILRHAIWQVDLPDGRAIPSFQQQIYRTYQKSQGQSINAAPPMDARHRWYVPMGAGPGAYSDGFSVVDLVYGALDPGLFADKIVLIGPYEAGMQDSYPTAVDHAAPMHGVEFQANAVAALLSGDLKREAAAAPQLLLLLVLTLAAALWFRDRKILTATVTWLAVCAAWLGVCLLAFRGGLVLFPLYIPLSVTACYLYSVAVNYVRAALEKRRVTRTFERYVAPEIVSELLHGDSSVLELGGKLCDIAVLFVDIRGFTPMSEGLEPPTVVEIINRYLTLTSQCIFQNGGTLDKYVGDCTMAFWGAPLQQEDCIFKAVKAGLDMVEGSKALGEALEREFGRTVSFGVGVHFGPAVVGNIGSPKRMDYTAIGDTVNTSARLEANAPAGQILVSRVVADALQGRVRFTSLGDSIRLKGKAAGFEILRVEGLVTPETGKDGIV